MNNGDITKLDPKYFKQEIKQWQSRCIIPCRRPTCPGCFAYYYRKKESSLLFPENMGIYRAPRPALARTLSHTFNESKQKHLVSLEHIWREVVLLLIHPNTPSSMNEQLVSIKP